MKTYEWCAFYNSFAHKLLEYKNKRPELIEIIKSVFSEIGIKLPTLEKDNKIIDINNGKNFISPNLLVDNDLINANHSAYIGKFKKDVVFYLKSRGIRDKECNSLLIKGFLLEKMNLDELMMEEYVNFINSNLG